MSKRLALVESLIAQGSQDPFVWYARAMELRSLARLEDALHAYEDVKTRFPHYVPTYLMAGQVAAELSMWDAARAWLQKGIECARGSGEAHALSELQAALAALPDEGDEPSPSDPKKTPR